MYDIIIQIVNFNTKLYLIKCLKSVINDLNNLNIKYKINILDNCSDDDLSDLEKQYKNYPISFYKSNINWWFWYGHNILSQKDNWKYLFILNPDTLLIEKNSIQRLYTFIKTNDNIKVIWPKVKTSNNRNYAWDHWKKFLLFNNILSRFWLSIWFPTNKIIEVNRICWCSMFIDKDIFDILWWFDEEYFLYKEEEDLCLKIRNYWYKIVYYPIVTIIHIWSVVAQKSKYSNISNTYFKQKWFYSLFKSKIIKKIIRKIYE